jgi:hypothetical protein
MLDYSRNKPVTVPSDVRNVIGALEGKTFEAPCLV